jgi:transcriptional repressor NrdR
VVLRHSAKTPYFSLNKAMNCPQCHSDALKVIDSRNAETEPAIRRRRECESCGYRFTTYERIGVPDLRVIKKDGRREAYDRSKLTRGIWRAVEKRPVADADIEGLVTQVEHDLRNTGESEISSDRIGEIVMQHLKELDDIAYIRFASVYRSFEDLGELQREVAKTMKSSTTTKT